MLKMSFLELFIRLIPESFTMLYLINVLSKEKITIRKYLIISAFVSILVYLVRFLPIYFGIHVIVNIIIYIYVVTVSGIPIVKSIRNTLLAFLILEFCEFINMILLLVFNIEIDEYTNIIFKNLLGSPSLILLILIIIIIKNTRNKH